ncbi:MAG: GNAT family N-acetyltransferase [bacterium]
MASRLERAEGRANVASVESRAAIDPSVGATWIEVDGTLAMFDGAGSPLTQTFGLGMSAAPSTAALDELESFFASRGVDTMHETCPLGDPKLLQILPDRGYRPIEQSTVLYQPLSMTTHAVPEANTQLRVRRTTAGESQFWATICSQGWGDTPELAQFMLDFGRIYAAAEGMICFVAEWEGEPAAAAALSVQNGIAVLAGASTIPAFRRRGAQTALLHARLAHGAQVGCDVAMMTAAPGSGSQRNAERRGLRIAYTRTKWALKHAGTM